MVTVIQGFYQSANLSRRSSIKSQQINYSCFPFTWVLWIRLDRSIMYACAKIRL